VRRSVTVTNEIRIAYLFMLNVPPPVWHARLTDQEQTLGRHPDCEILLPDQCRTVSRRHAAAWISQGKIWVRDLGSRAGTLINGVRIPAQRPIQIEPTDRLGIGEVELTIVTAWQPTAVSEGDETASLVRRNSLTVGTDVTTQGEFSPLDLTPAEIEILVWMRRGYTSLDSIGQKLYRSSHTVRTQLASIFRKLDVHSREELLGQLQREAAQLQAYIQNLRSIMDENT